MSSPNSDQQGFSDGLAPPLVSLSPERMRSGGEGPGQASGAAAGTSDQARFTRRQGGLRKSGRPIPPKLYRIGEVVEYSGMSRQTIHNYTTMGLLRECRWTNGGHRLYDESVFGRLDKISELRNSHKSIEDIREFFAQLDRRLAVQEPGGS